MSDDTVQAVGAFSEAVEWIERARGRLYDFHQMIGHADLLIDDAARAFDEAGQHDVAARIRSEIVGRNVLPGRWTFQVVEEFDDHYYAHVKDTAAAVRDEFMGGRRHVFESEMKERRRTDGLRGHEREPDEWRPPPASDDS